MILIGQYDSPFVRRVGIALTLYGQPFEHEPWSVWDDAEKIAAYSPLRRVPVLVFDSGVAIADSQAILAALDELVPAEKRLRPSTLPERLRELRTTSLALGIAEKTVSLLYERMLHRESSERWVARCTGQIRDTLAALEQERKTVRSAYWFGTRLSHTDIAIACAVRTLREVLTETLDLAAYPTLLRHCNSCEALEAFQAIYQRLSLPAQ